MMALAIYFEGSLDATTGLVSCEATSCGKASTLSTAEEFAADNDAWLATYHDAFIAMTNSGCVGTGDCSAV